MNNKILLVLVFVAVLGLTAWGFIRFYSSEPVMSEKVYTIGLLQMAPIVSQNMEGFKAGMAELGFIEGKNVNYVYRDAEGDLDLLKQYAQELAGIDPDMVFVNTSPATAEIIKATANKNIPVVFSMVADPLAAGFVDSIKSSNNNLCGTSCAYVDAAPKRLEVLSQTFPWAKKILVYYREADASAKPCTERILEKGEELGLEVTAYPIMTKADIEEHLASLKPGDYDVLMDPADSMMTSLLDTLVQYSFDLKMPYFGLSKGEVEKGATAGYAVDYFDLGKQSSLIANQVLMGIPPANIPIEMPRRWFFAINLDSAEKIGIQIPPAVLESANLVIDN